MAIEPIKGFYVHDEATNTDGVAEVDYYSASGSPTNAEVPLTLNSGYLDSGGGVASASSAGEVYSDVFQVRSGDKLEIVLDSKAAHWNWLAIAVYGSMGSPKINSSAIRREVLLTDSNFAGRRIFTYTIPYLVGGSANARSVANVSITFRAYGGDVAVIVNVATSNISYLNRAQAQYAVNYFSHKNRRPGYLNADGTWSNIARDEYSLLDYIAVTAGEKWSISCFGDYQRVTADGLADGREPWLYIAFFDSEYNLLLRQAGTSALLSVEVPENGAYMLAGGRWPEHGRLMLTKGEEQPIGFVPATDDLYSYTIPVAESVPDYSNFEIGNIYMQTSGWNYLNSTTRVRTKNGVSLSLSQGDKVYFTDPQKAMFYPGYYDGENYVPLSWQFGVFVAPKTAEYSFVLMYREESTIADKSDILSDFRIETKNDGVLVNVANALNNSTPAEVDISYVSWAFGENVKSVNHRGYYTAPENTLPAYKLSKKQGFKYAECDVSMTSDRVPVLLHDNDINRTARNADGTAISETISIGSITYEEALEYDFGIYKSSEYAGTKIPKFEDFIILCRNLGLHPYIELKGAGGYTESEVQNLVDIVEANGMKGKVSWISFSQYLLAYVKNYDGSARLGYVVSEVDAGVITTAQSFQTPDNEVFIDAGAALTDTEVSLCLDAGLPLEVWTVNDVSAIENLDPYVSGVTSDNLIASKVLYDANKD